MSAADGACRAALRGATLADVLAHRASAAPDRRRVLLLEHSMTVADALQARSAPRSMRSLIMLRVFGPACWRRNAAFAHHASDSLNLRFSCWRRIGC
jgi:hypothetical protein